jgi:hypothetical protein
MAKIATLTSGLVAKKGQAAPALDPVIKIEPKTPAAEAYYKSLTVKLDRQRYTLLKTAGIAHDKNSQTILVEALDLWLAQP